MSSRDASVDEFARLVLVLPPTDHQLIVFQRDFELLAPETGQCQGNAQHLDACSVAVVGYDAFDVVGRITVTALADAVDQPFHFLKTQEQWA